MIKIKISNNNINERKYIIDIIFNEFLGLKCEISTGSNNYEIILPNDTKLIIEDHFFNEFPDDLEYLKHENTPTTLNYQQKKNNSFIVENDIPIIYGTNKLENGNGKPKKITCGIDIFASSFFMLTRWEEHINKNRDNHNRFPATESLAFKNNFLDRPIVNEYVEMLKNMLLVLDDSLEFKKREYQLYLTHDVDFIYKWNTPKKFLRHLAGDIVLKKSINEFFLSIYNYTQMKLGRMNDPYDTFDYLMDISEKVGVKSHFFFMAKGLTNYDNNYKSDSLEASSLISKIKQRGHFIGIHPSYNAYNNKEQLKKEKQELEKNFETSITFGREHFLRFVVPTTWQVWEDNNMEWDSTVGYADKEGFRCGVCYEYSVFNIIKRKKLNLKEKPLIVMEASFMYQKNMTVELIEKSITNLTNKVKKYNGDFVFLWHNSSFNTKEWKKFHNIYEMIVENNA